MTTRRFLLAATAAIALAACDRATTEPTALAPTAASFRRGADDPLAQPRQEPQPGDDRGGQTQATDDKGQHAQPGDDKGGKGRGADDPANHG